MHAVAAACLACAAFAAAAADITFRSAWMRPAPAGAEAARAYIDIESTTPLELTGAATPVAARVLLVRTHRLDDPTSEEVVKSMAVKAGTPTRLAYRGDHLRLVDVKQDLANGTLVPLTLTFRDAKGKVVQAKAEITVRGLLTPQQMPDNTRDAPPAPAPGARTTAPARM